MKLVCAFVAALAPFLVFGQTPKKKITRVSDIPVFEYPVTGKVEDLLKSPDAFRAFGAQMRRNIDSVLAEYDIDDRATERSLLNVLAALDILEGKNEDAMQHMDRVKALQEKPGQKLMSGLQWRAVIAARKTGADRDSPEYRGAYYRTLRDALSAMPFATVQSDVKQSKATAEILSEALIVGQLRAIADPAVAKKGTLSSDIANGLPQMRVALVELLPMKSASTEALTGYLAAHQTVKPDIWAARSVTLPSGKSFAPVLVGVWDSGVDLTIFKDLVARDKSGTPMVIAYDIHSRKSTGEVQPFPEEQRKHLPEMKARIKGFLDIQANVDSPEASEVKKQIASLKPDDVKPYIEGLSLFGNYSHGTHVAGILVEGNPYARVVTGRITFDYKMVPDPCPSKEFSERTARAARETVRFFRDNGVRVVNMSWGGSVKDIERQIELCGTAPDVEERKKVSAELFAIESSALESAMRDASEILFVVAAGNSNNDAAFQEDIPASYKMPNILAVGAVDRAGDEAPFTSYGPTVTVHANGYEVESYVPGGDRIRFSGTSMASPSVANLAAKLLVVNPKLTPPELVRIITTSAEKTEDGRRFLMHPARALAAAQKH